jgi:hypothetical protein
MAFVLRTYNFATIRDIFLGKRKKKIKVHFSFKMQLEDKLRFLIFYFIILKLRKSVLFLSTEYNKINYHSLKRFLFFYIYYFFLKEDFLALKNYLSLSIKTIFNVKNIVCNFLVISNYNVNADFLSRYIACKLRLKYTVKEVMNPLLRELKRIEGSCLINENLHIRQVLKSIKYFDRRAMYAGFVRRIISFFNSYYLNQNFLYYEKVKI